MAEASISIPSEAEIREDRARDARGPYPTPEPYVSSLELIRDLAACDGLLRLMRDDSFARQFQSIIYNHDIRFDASGVFVAFPGEDSVHEVTARLRPFGERFPDMRDFYAEPDDGAMEQVRAFLAACGYSLHAQRFDY